MKIKCHFTKFYVTVFFMYSTSYNNNPLPTAIHIAMGYKMNYKF